LAIFVKPQKAQFSGNLHSAVCSSPNKHTTIVQRGKLSTAYIQVNI